MEKRSNHHNTPIENMDNVINKAEVFLQKNQRLLTIIVVCIFLIVGGYFGVKYLFLEPRQKAAVADMFYAECFFRADSLDLALNGDNTHPGFLDIIDNYSFTDAAQVANYYAGVCYLRKGEYETAIEFLKKFKIKSPLMYPMSLSCIADAYLELKEYDQAIKYYRKASSSNENDFTTPKFLLREAIVLEHLEKYAEAIDVYTKIQKRHVQSVEAREVDRHIARVQQLMNQK